MRAIIYSDVKTTEPETSKSTKRDNKKQPSHALETSETTPSRKSTRKSPGHVKPDSNLRRRATRATRSPKARAARSQAANR